ncbi:c-type cytochrome [Methyloradius palustris]|uniref:Cytochrome c domain-containing protein n=1 Tax=Methyloradius palustris TaxID=2778876 RepID=A0A8D5G3Z7_9PROT|nr:c-type cytochrome [Methyloradius palustris]BCM25568.1 hypothetical protein ZMTM_18270 [Methyloradius palustris]
MMAVRKIASNLLSASDELSTRSDFVKPGFVKWVCDSGRVMMLEIVALFCQPFKHYLLLLKPTTLLVSASVVGFLFSGSPATAAEIKLASADNEISIIPNTVNIAENSPVFSSHIRTLAASCAACHGTNGNSVGGMPVLAGLDPTRFVVQIQAFRSGERASSVMHHHAKGLTPEEIEQLSRYFAAQKRVQVAAPANQKLDTRHDD